PAPPERPGELERAEDAVGDDGEEVEHHRQRAGEEPRVRLGDRCAARQLGEPGRAGRRRHEAEQDQQTRNEPFGSGRGFHGAPVYGSTWLSRDGFIARWVYRLTKRSPASTTTSLRVSAAPTPSSGLKPVT